MSTENQLHNILQNIERAMRELALWQIEPPEDQAFESVEPFCIDTMKPEQWLQWVFIPRLYALSSHGSVLPSDSFIAPLF